MTDRRIATQYQVASCGRMLLRRQPCQRGQVLSASDMGGELDMIWSRLLVHVSLLYRGHKESAADSFKCTRGAQPFAIRFFETEPVRAGRCVK